MKIKSAKKPAVAKTIVKKTRNCGVKSTCAKAAEKKPVTFTFHAEKDKAVYLAGEFNDWNPSAKKMAYKVRQGVYTATINLAAGEYQYKFVIDGAWCADPENANAVPNAHGTFNSVIVVK